MISVVIPFFSNLSWLDEALKSVYNQTFKNTEIIVVNDGSLLDDTEFLNRHGSFITYLKTSNLGPGHARNFGIKASKGEYIAFLDSDDLWHPQKLERQLSYMEKNNKFWSHTSYTLFDNATNKDISVVDVGFFLGNVFVKSLISSPVATPCVMIKRNILLENPEFKFSEIMRYGQDGYMWLSLSTKYELGVINESLTKVRIRGSNAALKARVYLQVKSQIWNSIKYENQFFNYRNKIPFLVKIAYLMCLKSFKWIRLFETKTKFSSTIIELLSKFLYLPSFILLKIQKNISF
ncbi:glycosyltransferase family 2 protein [Algoriphagus aestuarii]|nr:glycosyltransferase family 2 protein [Algoriphagus aestuarii]